LARILVIEDDPTFRDLLNAHISGAGHAVQSAEDAAVALRAIVTEPPELIVLDMKVPYLDSVEILEAIRSDPATLDIPVIVLTGSANDETYARAYKIGVQDYFTKPVQNEDLIKAIATQLAVAARKRNPLKA
jgi:CheY-like chemotaxis protein